MRYEESRVSDLVIAYIGGGSRGWAWGLMNDLAMDPHMEGEVRLYDIDREAAEMNMVIGNRTAAHPDAVSHWRYTVSGSLREALTGADFVVISILPATLDEMQSDVHAPEKLGVYQSVGDTTGPGGFMRAMRTIPMFVEIAEAIRDYAPRAWVINYTNPMTLCTAALYKAFPGIKALGCCHEVFHTETFLAEKVAEWFGVPQPDRREIKVDITGVNHFTWVTRASWQGIDLMPRLKEMAEDENTYSDLTEIAKARIKEEKWFDCDHLIALSLLRDFGALGAAGDRHLSEFVPFFLNSDEELWKYGVVRTPYSWRVEEDKRKKAKVFTPEELKATASDEEGVDIMCSLMGERTLFTNINFPNKGQISYLKKGRIVESNGFISQDSIQPVVSTDPPLAVQNMVRRVSDIQEMVLEAIWSGDQKLLFSAFLSDPLVNLPRNRAKELFDRMLEASS